MQVSFLQFKMSALIMIHLLSMSINQVIDRYKEKMKLYMNEEILVQEQSSDIKTSE